MCVDQKLRPNVQKVYDLKQQGYDDKHIAKELSLSLSSVKTYYYQAKKILDLIASEVKKVIGSKEKAPELKRCSSFGEFVNMMNKIESPTDKSAEERIEIFKDVYCKVCPYPNRCSECPTKILLEKYLF